MYQLVVKYHIVKFFLESDNGWEFYMHIDPMERAQGTQHKPDKKDLVLAAEKKLKELGVRFTNKPKFEKVDIYAEHPKFGKFLIEVEGKSSKQKEQALYSALGQLVLKMNGNTDINHYCLAFPDTKEWEITALKIPKYIKEFLKLKIFLVSESKLREI